MMSRLFLPFASWKGTVAGMIRRWALPPVCVLAAGMLPGCQDSEIRHYAAPKPDIRLLALMLPHEDEVWFFKLVGPAREVNDHEVAFKRFIETMRFTDNAEQPVSWIVPEGWSEGAASNMRYATFVLGNREQPLELSIIRLPKKSNSVKRNVNRWRAQIGLEPISVDELTRVSNPIKLPAGTGTWVDMMSRTPELSGDMPPAQPFAVYDPPAGWRKMDQLPIDAIAGFKVGEGDQTVDVTVTPLPNRERLLDNINRWRVQLGLDEIDADRMDKEIKSVEVDGEPAFLVDLTGERVGGRAPQRIVGAIVEMNNLIWYIKMRGPADAVGKQQDSFASFLQSVRFDAGAGANDE